MKSFGNNLNIGALQKKEPTDKFKVSTSKKRTVITNSTNPGQKDFLVAPFSRSATNKYTIMIIITLLVPKIYPHKTPSPTITEIYKILERNMYEATLLAKQIGLI